MTRNTASASEDHVQLRLDRRGGRAAVGLAAAALLGVFAWLDLAPALAGSRLSLLGALSWLALAAALALACGLALAPLASPAWRCRLAFLTAPLFVLAQGLFLWLATGSPPAFFALLLSLAAAGGFLGAFALSTWRKGLWENNSPPSPAILAYVRARHAGLLGRPAAVPPAKRLFDCLFAGLGLAVSLPFSAAAAFLIWWEDPGPVLFVKNSVGKDGVNFRQYKFRTMVSAAEDPTGPVLSRRDDARVLKIGRFLRKTALDELPQLLNILRGEMSLVGPRPQRTVLVHGYLQALPEYAQRHRVLPGLSGLAQVAGDYYLTPRQKLRFDRLYIAHAGLGFDLKLVCLAFLIAFWFRWQKSWNGRLPRRLLRFGSKTP